jgi:hypothetical protein
MDSNLAACVLIFPSSLPFLLLSASYFPQIHADIHPPTPSAALA